MPVFHPALVKMPQLEGYDKSPPHMLMAFFTTL
jgi:hypothetical protein